MSDQSAATGQGPVIAKAGKRKWGYDVAQVDAFLARAHALYESDKPELTQHDIQTASFDLVKDGYAIAQVDAALSRLERAVVDKRTSWELAHGGRVPFKVHSEEMLSSLKAHYLREPKQRFKPGEGKHPSYDRKQVDRVVDQVIAKASSALGEQGSLPADAKELLDVTASRISNVIFTQRKGKRGYDERSVDYYLDVAVQLLSRLESFARVSEYAAETVAPSPAPAVQEAPAPVPPIPAPAPAAVPQSDRAAAAGAQPTQVIPPLFTPSGQPNAEAQRAADSFSALNAAEHSIFAPKPAAPVPATAAPAPVPPVPAPAVPVPSPVPSVPSVSSATTAPAEPTPAPIVSDSLAALAQSVPQHVETESAPTEAIAPVHDAPFGEPSATVTAHVPSVAAPASHVVQTAAAQTAAAPAPVSPVAVPPTTITPVQSVQPAAVPPAPLAAQTTQPVPVAQPTPIPPTPVIAPKLDGTDAKPQDEGDRYLANLLNDTSFPKIDLDIPDLSFPSLSDDGSDIIDTPKKDGDQQSR